jgi:hypothetical protein
LTVLCVDNCFLDHCVGQVRIIFQPVTSDGFTHPYLVYAQRFDCITNPPKASPDSGLFRLKRAMRRAADRTSIRIGAVVEANKIRCAVSVEPFFGNEANRALTCTNSLEISTKFNLNTFSDKETFELLREPDM